jgi:hypothetical protein
VGFQRTAKGMTAGKNPYRNKFNLIQMQPKIARWTATIRIFCEKPKYFKTTNELKT